MKAIQVTHYAPTDNLKFATDVPKPAVKPKSKDVLIRILACALNPADSHLMEGRISLVMNPKEFPYTVGLDVCGVVEEVGSACQAFKKGDRVLAVLQPLVHGGLAEYVVCDASLVTQAPKSMTPIEAASIITVGCTAVQALKSAKLKKGAKVIVLGASGGIGTLMVQLLKAQGASFIAATSTNKDLVTSLGADEVIDYRSANWWEVLEGRDLDVVFDCVGCDDSWQNCKRSLARRGRYVAVVDRPDPQIRSVWQLLSFIGFVMGRSLNPFSTSYTLVSSFPTGREVGELVDLVEKAEARAVLDPSSPFPFSLEGMLAALEIQRSRRAKGKLVFKIAE
ncbi:hypothetical protein ATCC90586_005628 [Pythium insidiosum]|nr:hypothetical protein ATCC90586_005628 [Pythium insidiosum]